MGNKNCSKANKNKKNNQHNIGSQSLSTTIFDNKQTNNFSNLNKTAPFDFNPKFFNKDEENKETRKSSTESSYYNRPSKVNTDFVSKNFENTLKKQSIASIKTLIPERISNLSNNTEYSGNCQSSNYLSTNENSYFDSSNTLGKKLNEDSYIPSPISNISNDLRRKFYSKLQKKAIWNHPMEKSTNNIIIFDWDDTLMFTFEYFSFLSIDKRLKNLKDKEIYKEYSFNSEEDSENKSQLKRSNSNYLDKGSKHQNESDHSNTVSRNTEFSGSQSFFVDYNNLKLIDTFTSEFNFRRFKSFNITKLKVIKSIQTRVFKILEQAIEKGDVFIISNASLAWILYSSQTFFPDVVKKLFPYIKLISARDHFVSNKSTEDWKRICFNKVSKSYSKLNLTNIVVIGDSNLEITAADEMIKKFKHSSSYLKTIKLKEKPTFDVLDKQLELVENNFDRIFKQLKSVSINVNRK